CNVHGATLSAVHYFCLLIWINKRSVDRTSTKVALTARPLRLANKFTERVPAQGTRRAHWPDKPIIAHSKEELKMPREDKNSGMVSRRTLLHAAAGLSAGVLLPSTLSMPAFAVGVGDKPPIGTWPTGSEGDTVNVGAAVPRTGTYAVQGE